MDGVVVALTGGTGFVGRRIAEALRARKFALRCLVRPQSDAAALKALGAQLIQGDLDDDDSLAELTDGAAVVVHAAAWHQGKLDQVGGDDPIEHFDKNLMGSLSLLESARQNCKQFIFLSSGAVYGSPPGNLPLDEESPPSPDNCYGAYKASVEMFCQAYARQFDFNTSILRPVAVLGVHEPIEQSPFYELVSRTLAGEMIETSKGQKAVMVEDVAKAVAMLVGRDDAKGETFNLCDQYVRHQDVAQLAAQAAGVPPKITPTPQSGPQHDMPSGKIKRLGLQFGGREALNAYVRELVKHALSTQPATAAR